MKSAQSKEMGKQETAKKYSVGRPSKISSINLEQVKKLVLKNFTDKELADFFEVSEVTLNAWKKKRPEFLKSLKDWKAEADKEVEKSLYLRAKGYQHEEDKIFCEMGKVTIVPTIKHYPPDPTACIFWLKNRQPEQWRDKVELDHGLTEGLLEKFATSSVNDLLTKANALINGHATNKSK